MLRILVIDDDPEKRDRIRATLLTVHGIEGTDISFSHNVRDALEELAERRFDIVVLDIALPMRSGESVRRHGGLQVVRDVFRNGKYLMPTLIVAMTAYADIRDELGKAVAAESGSVLIHYSPESDEWRDLLIAAVTRMLRVREDEIRMGTSFQSLCCIVCALRTPELQAVLNLPWSWGRHTVAHDPTSYWRGEVSGKRGKHIVYSAHAHEMGGAAAAALTIKMIERFHPRLLAIVGIAGGIPDAIRLGDVIVADPTWDYCSGKIDSVDGVPRFQKSPRQLGLSPIMRSQVGNVASDSSALGRLVNSVPKVGGMTDPRIVLGPLASGPFVIANAAVRDQVKDQHRKLLGLDMETYGVFCAASESSSPFPLVVSLKAVSDFAGSDKSDGIQSIVAHRAAGAFKELLETQFIPWIESTVPTGPSSDR